MFNPYPDESVKRGKRQNQKKNLSGNEAWCNLCSVMVMAE